MARFDWTGFHKHLHNHDAIDPQCAEVNLEERTVTYGFYARATVDPKTKQTLYAGNDDSLGANARVFVTALTAFFPELKVEIGSGRIEGCMCGRLQKNEIGTYYQAKSKKEMDKIAKYLRSVRLDDGGMPKKEDTFFCYD